MAAIKIRTPRDFKCRNYREHLRQRIDERQFIRPMSKEFDAWMKTGPSAPDLVESPAGQGWHKRFDSFLILGEGECVKTVYTIYAKGNPRPNSVDLDEWEAQGRKPKISSVDIIAAAVFGDEE